MQKKVLLVYGGYSAEREVSISAEKDTAEALRSKGYNVIEYELNDTWKFIDALREIKPDVVYNGLYGNWGEDGEIQALFDMLKIPYTHSSMLASACGMNKNITKLIAEQKGVKTPKGECLSYKEFMQRGTMVPFPYVIKPQADGSSVGVYIIKNKKDLEKVHYENDKTEILIEKFISGRELTVMCLEGKAYNVTELCAKNEFYDYEAKYTDGYTQHILPAQIPQDVTDTCLKYAEIMHNALKCNTLSRCDFRYNPEDGVVFLEINTNPGMTALSLVPEQARYIGISYADLCAKMVENADFRKI